jgi:hypothetical protein
MSMPLGASTPAPLGVLCATVGFGVVTAVLLGEVWALRGSVDRRLCRSSIRAQPPGSA